MLVLILCLAPHRFSDFYASLFKGLKGDHLFINLLGESIAEFAPVKLTDIPEPANFSGL